MGKHKNYPNEATQAKSVQPVDKKLYLNFFWDLVTFFLYIPFVLIRNFYRVFFPLPPKSLKNEIVLVTGGGNGIGREICKRLAEVESSLKIITWDVNERDNLETVGQVKATGFRNIYPFTVDVTKREQVELTAKKIRQEIGDVSILFNNAGISGEIRDSWTQDPATIEKVFQVNVISHYWTLQAFFPKMLENRKGHIVETCSILGFIPSFRGSPYGASKFAIRGFMESLKEDIRHVPGEKDIVCSVVYPNFISTNMTKGLHDVVKPKYPFLVHKFTPRVAACRIVLGVQKNEEHIYIPDSIRLTHSLINTMAPDVLRRLLSTIFEHKGVNSEHEE